MTFSMTPRFQLYVNTHTHTHPYSSSLEMLLPCWPQVVWCFYHSEEAKRGAEVWPEPSLYGVFNTNSQDATLPLPSRGIWVHSAKALPTSRKKLIRYLWITLQMDTQKSELWNHIQTRYRAVWRSHPQPQRCPSKSLGEHSDMLIGLQGTCQLSSIAVSESVFANRYPLY